MRLVAAVLAAIVLSLSASQAGARAAIVLSLSASQAGAQNPYEPAVREIVNRTWNAPCGGEYSITRERLPIKPDIVFGRSWHGPFPVGSPFCAIALNDRIRYTPGAYCTTVLHEGGHLFGWLAPLGGGQLNEDGTRDRLHSDNPRSVMAQATHRYPFLLDYRCRVIGRTFDWRVVE